MSERDNLITALMTRYELDESSAKSVIDYAKSLSVPDRKSNDFALAKALNERVYKIIGLVADAYNDQSSVAPTIDIQALNRCYVLLVNELKKIYLRNNELTDLSPTPLWKYIDIIEGAGWEIREQIFQNQDDGGIAHNAQVNKLCIINGKEVPDYLTEIEKLIAEADKNIGAYKDSLDLAKTVDEVFTPDDWFIPEYKLTYGLNGTILINDVLRLKKLNSGSISEKLIEQAQKQPNTLFKPDLRTSRNLSTSLSSMGFKDALRQIFFPVVNQHKGILYRPVVSRSMADAEKINTSKLDYELKKAGAKTESYPIDIPF